MIRRLKALLCILPCLSALSAQPLPPAYEYQGDHYVIHVDALKPDKDMTLMDVLQACPELMSDNAKRITDYYELYIDDVPVMLDDEVALEALKASELSEIHIYTSTSIVAGGNGDSHIINLQFKPLENGSTAGKLMLEGSTFGCGKAYTDINTRYKNLTIQGYALCNLEYGRGAASNGLSNTFRQGIENLHLNLDWDISKNDNLKIKLLQAFMDHKLRLYPEGGDATQVAQIQRYWAATAIYDHTLNQRGANLHFEGGVDREYLTIEDMETQNTCAYFVSEASTPCLNDHLNLMAGWEIDYYNWWNVNVDRQHTMFNDLYLQVDYSNGPWLVSFGDRFRVVNYWHHVFDDYDGSRWSNSRTENSYVGSVGYKSGRHQLQAMFNSDYYVPLIIYFFSYQDEDATQRINMRDYYTSMVYRTELRYAYQWGNLMLSGSALHSWTRHSAIGEKRTGIRASMTWRKGVLRLTAGADYFHTRTDTEGQVSFDNTFHLRLLPTLLLPGGLRVSSRLLYNSRVTLPFESSPHLFASVKVSKDLGRHITLSADLHDLAGPSPYNAISESTNYANRALSLGFTYRFGRH